MASSVHKNNIKVFHIFYLLILGFILSSLMTACGDDTKKEAAQEKTQQAIPAKVVKAKSEDVSVYGEFVGKTEAVNTVEIQARIEGFLKERLFREGSIVKKGDLLFTIDPSQQEQSVNDAKAQVDQVQALLDKARLDVSRFGKLYKTGAISREEYDQKTTNEKNLAAQLDQAKASLADARINLGYTKVYAPLTGVIGRADAKIGALVGKGENTLLATISSIDPMYVNFSVAENAYLNYVMRRKKDQDSSADLNDMQLILADDIVYPYKGQPDMADREVDPTTGTLGVRAVFANPDNILKQGQFAKVRFVVQKLKDAIIVPMRSVVSFQGTNALLVVKDDGTVERRSVTLGPLAPDNMQVITEGIKSGEVVISDGVNKIRPGDKVTPQFDTGSDKPQTQAGTTPEASTSKDDTSKASSTQEATPEKTQESTNVPAKEN